MIPFSSSTKPLKLSSSALVFFIMNPHLRKRSRFR
uniref:Uncharacterized protein n=1 Tax=Brassica oleracea TaxID=3712 RepID=A0A3P6DZH5_BRAOL|nr:unnamed protein product [Brassica oleracea]